MLIRGDKSDRQPRHTGRGGFTLLEIMLAVLVMAMLVVVLYSFVEANLRAIAFSRELNVERQSVVSLCNYVQEQLGDLPPRGQGMLTGEAHKYRDLANDEMSWICEAGSGVLTSAAPERYRVTLTIQAVEKNSTAMEIGIRRREVEADERKFDWVPLLRDVTALEIRYFDSRQNSWLERWRDPNARPSLVRVRVWRASEEAPYEAVLTVPAANVQG